MVVFWELKLMGEFAISLSFGNIISYGVNILDHLHEIWLFLGSLMDNVLGHFVHVSDLLSTIFDALVVHSTKLTIILSGINISHDGLSVFQKFREIW